MMIPQSPNIQLVFALLPFWDLAGGLEDSH
jgi:hypothetical protein